MPDCRYLKKPLSTDLGAIVETGLGHDPELTEFLLRVRKEAMRANFIVEMHRCWRCGNIDGIKVGVYDA